MAEFRDFTINEVDTNNNVVIIEEIIIEDNVLFDYISDTYEPEEIFSDELLKKWAQDFDPEDIFDERELAHWAATNGFVKVE